MFFKEKPSPQLRVSVIVPVKNEAETISICLDALRVQKSGDQLLLSPHLYEVLLLANNCDDDTYRIILEYKEKFPEFNLQVEELFLNEEIAYIGTARRFLMDAAYNRFLFLGKMDGIISSTDGDSCVDELWIWQIMQEMAKGCDVVGGLILTEIEECAAKKYHLLDLRYQNLIAKREDMVDPQPHNPWPSHFQCFGANFSITCKMYAQAGRLPEVSCLEDVAFYKILEMHDAKIRKSPYVKVLTSTRKNGRVEKGLSQQLAYFEEIGCQKEDLKVECAQAIISRLKIKKSLRELWKHFHSNRHTQDPQFVAKPLNEVQIMYWLSKYETFGAVWEEAQEYLNEIEWFNQWELVDINIAIHDLESAEGMISRKLKMEEVIDKRLDACGTTSASI